MDSASASQSRLRGVSISAARPIRLAYSALAALLIAVYISVLARGLNVGVDYACFRAASLLLAQGGNPYDYGQLFRVENALYNLPHRLQPGTLGFYRLDEYRNPTLFATLLTPLARLPLETGFLLYTAGVIALALAAAWLTLRTLSWTRRRGEVIAVTLLSPCVFLCVWNGQQSTLLLCALAGALYALRRERPGLAGALLAIGWIKPNLLIPVALLAPLLLPSWRAAWRCYAGFGAVTALGVALTLMTTGAGSIAAWLRDLLGYTGYSHVAGVTNVDALQSYLPSLSGMGLVLLPRPWNMAVAVTAMLLGLLVMLWLIARAPPGHGALGSLEHPGRGVVAGGALRAYQRRCIAALGAAAGLRAGWASSHTALAPGGVVDALYDYTGLPVAATLESVRCRTAVAGACRRVRGAAPHPIHAIEHCASLSPSCDLSLSLGRQYGRVMARQRGLTSC